MTTPINPRPRPRRRTMLIVALAVTAGLLVVAGGAVLAFALTADSPVTPATQTTPAPTAGEYAPVSGGPAARALIEPKPIWGDDRKG